MKRLQQYTATARICAKGVFDGGLLSVAGEYLVRFLQLILLVQIWRSFGESSALPDGMSLPVDRKSVV